MSKRQYIDFRFVKERASFDTILAHYNITPAVTRGPQRRIHCPFHDDRRPSCEINVKKGIYHCFACEAHGNALEFVAAKENLGDDLRAAARLVATICDIPAAPPGASREHSRNRSKSASGGSQKPKTAQTSSSSEKPATDAPEASSGSINPPLTCTLKLNPSHPYLASRGVSRAAIETFGVGFAKSGIMQGRIAIPIHDHTGELVAYAGRWADDDIPEDVERYKLPPRFQKSEVLYNLHRFSKPVQVAIVESYWSVFRLHELGVPAVALMGRSISKRQVELLQAAGLERVLLLLDGDEPGRKATASLLPLLAHPFFVRAPAVPDSFKPHRALETELRDLLGR